MCFQSRNPTEDSAAPVAPPRSVVAVVVEMLALIVKVGFRF